jgi:hypothetical protein
VFGVHYRQKLKLIVGLFGIKVAWRKEREFSSSASHLFLANSWTPRNRPHSRSSRNSKGLLAGRRPLPTTHHSMPALKNSQKNSSPRLIRRGRPLSAPPYPPRPPTYRPSLSTTISCSADSSPPSPRVLCMTCGYCHCIYTIVFVAYLISVAVTVRPPNSQRRPTGLL